MELPIIGFRGQRKPWNSIPQINWGHPLTKNLLFYHYDTGAGGYDLARSRKLSFRTANPISRIATRFGTGYQFPSSVADGIQYLSDPSVRILPPFGWACGFLRTAASAELDALFNCRAANNITGAPFCNWGIAINHLSTAGNIGCAVNSAGAKADTVGVVSPLNSYQVIVATCPDTANLAWWINGKPQTTKTGLTIQNVSVGDNIVLGTDGGGPGGFLGQIYWSAFWNRKLTQQEALQLYLDPYCFLIYPEDEVFAELVGVTAVTTSEDQWHQEWSSIGRRIHIIGTG